MLLRRRRGRGRKGDFRAPRRGAWRARLPALVAAGSVGLLVSASALGGASAESLPAYHDLALRAVPVGGGFERAGYLFNPMLSFNVAVGEASLNTGGTRDGFVSLLDVGPLQNVVGALGFAFPQLSEVPAVPYPLSGRTTYPGTPEAAVGVGGVGDGGGAGGLDAVSGRSRSSAEGVSTEARLGDVVLAQGTVRARSVRSEVRVAAAGGEAVGEAFSVVGGIDVLGILAIDTLTSRTTARAGVDGSSVSSKVSAAGVRVLGYEATVDDEGVRVTGLTGAPSPPPGVLAQLNRDVAERLRGSGVTFRMVSSASASAPADGSTAAAADGAGLHVQYDLVIPPDVPIPAIPGSPVGLPVGGGIPTTFKLVLGGSSGVAVAGAPLDTIAPAAPSGGGPGTAGGATPSLAGGPDLAVTPLGEGGAEPSVGVATTVVGTGGTAGGPAPLVASGAGALPIGTVRPLLSWMAWLGIAAAGVMALDGHRRARAAMPRPRLAGRRGERWPP